MARVNATKYPEKLAFKDARGSLNFREFNTRTNKLANGLLANGLEKGDKITILSNNSIEFVELYVAAAKAGIVIVPLNFRLHPDDLNFIIDNSDSKMLFVESKFSEAASKFSARKIETVLIGPEPIAGLKFYEDIISQGDDH